MSAAEAQSKPFIASMGIYVFKKDQLVKLLKETYIQSNDFGGEIIPAAAEDHKVVAYLFNDYWEDIGTIKSFFEANLALAQQVNSDADFTERGLRSVGKSDSFVLALMSPVALIILYASCILPLGKCRQRTLGAIPAGL